MTEPHPQLVTLFRRIASLSNEGKVQWKSVSPTSFTLQLAHGAVNLRSRDEDGAPPFEFTVYNEDAVPVDGMVAEGAYVEATEDLLDVQALYETARRSALGVSKVLDSLLADLPSEGDSSSADDDIPF